MHRDFKMASTITRGARSGGAHIRHLLSMANCSNVCTIFGKLYIFLPWIIIIVIAVVVVDMLFFLMFKSLIKKNVSVHFLGQYPSPALSQAIWNTERIYTVIVWGWVWGRMTASQCLRSCGRRRAVFEARLHSESRASLYHTVRPHLKKTYSSVQMRILVQLTDFWASKNNLKHLPSAAGQLFLFGLHSRDSVMTTSKMVNLKTTAI